MANNLRADDAGSDQKVGDPSELVASVVALLESRPHAAHIHESVIQSIVGQIEALEQAAFTREHELRIRVEDAERERDALRAEIGEALVRRNKAESERDAARKLSSTFEQRATARGQEANDLERCANAALLELQGTRDSLKRTLSKLEGFLREAAEKADSGGSYYVCASCGDISTHAEMEKDADEGTKDECPKCKHPGCMSGGYPTRELAELDGKCPNCGEGMDTDENGNWRCTECGWGPCPNLCGGELEIGETDDDDTWHCSRCGWRDV